MKTIGILQTIQISLLQVSILKPPYPIETNSFEHAKCWKIFVKPHFWFAPTNLSFDFAFELPSMPSLEAHYSAPNLVLSSKHVTKFLWLFANVVQTLFHQFLLLFMFKYCRKDHWPLDILYPQTQLPQPTKYFSWNWFLTQNGSIFQKFCLVPQRTLPCFLIPIIDHQGTEQQVVDLWGFKKSFLGTRLKTDSILEAHDTINTYKSSK